MGTTVWVEDATRQELRRLQTAFGTSSADATIRRLMQQPAADAYTLFGRHRKEIAAILKRHHMRGLVAFGSRARGDAGPTSDLDLAVEVGMNAGPLSVLSAENEFEDLLGMPVRIVELPNPKLASAIAKDGVRF